MSRRARKQRRHRKHTGSSTVVQEFFHKPSHSLTVGDYESLVRRYRGHHRLVQTQNGRYLLWVCLDRAGSRLPVDELSLLLSALAAHLPSMDWRPTDIFDYASLANKLAHSFEWADGQSGNESMQAFQLKNRAISVLLRRFPEFVEIEPDHESDQFCLVRLPRVVRTGLHVPVSVIEQCLGPNWRSRNGNTHSPPHA